MMKAAWLPLCKEETNAFGIIIYKLRRCLRVDKNGSRVNYMRGNGNTNCE